jgi:hypothetical protein
LIGPDIGRFSGLAGAATETGKNLRGTAEQLVISNFEVHAYTTLRL